MPTYTLTIDFASITLPTVDISFFNTIAGIGSDSTPYNSMDDAMQAIGTFYTNEYGGTATVTNVGDVYTLTFTPNTDPSGTANGELVSVFIQDNLGATYAYAWQYSAPQETTPCPTCMALNITNCGPVTIDLPLPDDDYTVSIVDNQSGVVYTQNVQWTGGTGTWNTTNTAGVFTPFSIYTLTVFDSSGLPVSWPVGTNEYTCARVTFSATVDTNSDG